MSDPVYERAFQHIISIEGVKFIDHPDDKGGPSRYGLSQRFLEDYFGRSVTPEEVKNLKLEDAHAIYRYEFWERLSLYALPERVSLCLIDQAIHSGIKSAVISMQRVIGAEPDGVLGPISRGLIISSDSRILCHKYLTERLSNYGRIVQRDRTQLTWLGGWHNRIMVLVGKTLL